MCGSSRSCEKVNAVESAIEQYEPQAFLLGATATGTDLADGEPREQHWAAPVGETEELFLEGI